MFLKCCQEDVSYCSPETILDYLLNGHSGSVRLIFVLGKWFLEITRLLKQLQRINPILQRCILNNIPMLHNTTPLKSIYIYGRLIPHPSSTFKFRMCPRPFRKPIFVRLKIELGNIVLKPSIPAARPERTLGLCWMMILACGRGVRVGCFSRS